MMDKNKIARDFGEALDKTLGEGPGASSLDMHKRVLTASMTGGRKQPRKQLFWVPAVAACCTIGVIVAVFLSLSDRQDTETQTDADTYKFKIGDSTHHASTGSFASSEMAERLPIVFENGSRFELVDQSAARVVETGSERVVVNLQSGHLDSFVNGDGKTKWMVEAGPYTVTVLGTVFSVNWNQVSGDLTVRVKEGSVRISDSTARDSNVTLQAGYLLSASSRSGEKVITQITSKPEPQVVRMDNPQVDAVPEPIAAANGEANEKGTPTTIPEKMPSNPSQGTEPSAEPVPLWKQHCDKRRFKEAVSTADARDLVEILNQADAETLWRLANAARHMKKADMARDLFQSLRKRFPVDERAGTSAYLIGKTLLEIEGNKSGAAKWFTQYLNENQNGSLAEDALGHLMGIYDSTGKNAKAKQYANQYLQRYATGPFAARASEILSR